METHLGQHPDIDLLIGEFHKHQSLNGMGNSSCLWSRNTNIPVLSFFLTFKVCVCVCVPLCMHVTVKARRGLAAGVTGSCESPDTTALDH